MIVAAKLSSTVAILWQSNDLIIFFEKNNKRDIASATDWRRPSIPLQQKQL